MAPWDAQHCPRRGPGLTHVSIPCEVCGGVPFERTHGYRSVPRAFWAAYVALRRGGLGDADAQSLIATRHGLWPPGVDELAGSVERRQRVTPWTLRHLAALMFLRRWAEDHPEPAVQVRTVRGRCELCPPGIPPHPRHVRMPQ